MAEKKTLYVSDLDGTLLNGKQIVSEFTLKTLNSLIEKGMIFSYATARSFVTASKAVEGLKSNTPIIAFNGTFILENGSGRRLTGEYFLPSETRYILSLLTDNGVYPIVYAFIDDKEKFSFVPQMVSKEMSGFLESRKGDIRENPVTEERLLCGDVFHFVCIEAEEKLAPLYDILKEKFRCVFYRDIYTNEQWLEIHPIKASKADGVLKLKNMLGCDRVVCFGDAANDIPMFEIADECYATANADERLKKIATEVIESNEADGVAKWLIKNAIK